MLKRGLVIGIMVLFLGMAFVPLTSSLSADNHIQNFNLNDDTTPPEISVEWEVREIDDGWLIVFTATCYDNESGMYMVAYYLNNKLWGFLPYPPNPIHPEQYIFPLFSPSRAPIKKAVFRFVAYNRAGLSAFVIVNGSDVMSYSYSQSSSQQSTAGSSSQNIMSVIPSTETVAIENQIWKSNLGYDNDTTPPVTTPSLDPTMPDGDNAWYVSDVTITLEAGDDMSGVNATYYRVNNGAWEIYTEPFVIQSDGHCLVEFYSVDNAGNVEDVKSFEIKIDQTIPEIEKFVYSAYRDGLFGEWYITFKVECNDDASGIDRAEFHINNGLVATDDEEPYEWTYEFSDIFGYVTIKAVVFDQAGNFDYDDYPEFESIPYWSDSEIIYDPESSQQNVGPSFIPSTGSITVEEYVSTDNQIQKSNLGDDTTPPVIEITWEVEYVLFKGWYVTINVNCYDEESGIDIIYIFLNDGLHEIITGSGPVYGTTYNFKWSSAMKNYILRVDAYDIAGNSATESLYFSDITPHPHSQQHSSPLFVQILQRLMNIR